MMRYTGGRRQRLVAGPLQDVNSWTEHLKGGSWLEVFHTCGLSTAWCQRQDWHCDAIVRMIVRSSLIKLVKQCWRN